MIQKSKWREWLIAITLGVFYIGAVGRIPVSYWDEMIWVGRSYFVDFYLKGDLSSPIWQSMASYDQPKLGEYMYGLWIYPKYLYEKSINKTEETDYPKFLIDHGLYLIEESYFDKYKEYFRKKLPEMVLLSSNESGDRYDYLETYGPNVLPAFDLVTYARKINILWLILAVVVAYKIMENGVGKYRGMIGAMIYGVNSLMVTSALKAHSEGLFILLFNISIWLMLEYFKKENWRDLLLLALSIGLCTNTKLNGLMLLPIFGVTYMVWTRKNINWQNIVRDCFTILVITLALLILVNPFLQDDPVGKIGALFEKRAIAAKMQSELFPKMVLATPMDRIVKIGVNFFSPLRMKTFNEIYGMNVESWLLSIGAVLVFLVGLWKVTISAIKDDKYSQYILLMCTGIVVVMSGYLLLDWERYYIQLVLPVVYFELVGGRILIVLICKWISKNYKKLWMVLIGVLLGPLTVEIYLRSINYPVQSCKTINEAGESVAGKFDPVLGWSYKEFSSIEQDGISYIFGEEGQRVSASRKNFLSVEIPKVLVIGDSILFGHGISAEDTFSEKLQRKLGNRYQVMNFSVQGYGTDQIYLLMQKLIPIYRPAMVITDYISDHDKRNVNQDRRYMFPCMKFSGTKPVFTVENGNLKQNNLPQNYTFFNGFKIRLVWQRFGESSKIKNWTYQEELTKALMLAMSDLARLNKVKLLTINFDTELTEYQRQSKQTSVVVVNNQENKSLYINDGVHPNSSGTTEMLEKFWSKVGKTWF